MNFNDLVIELESKCKKHDWTYHFSDDHRIWNKGKSAAQEIDAILAQMKAFDNDRAKDEYMRIRKAYDPLMRKDYING